MFTLVYWQAFFANLKRAFKHYSTWVVAAVTIAWGVFLKLTPEEQTAFLSAYPVLAQFSPYITGFAFLWAKGIPQGLARQIREAAAEAEQAAKDAQ